MPIPAPSPMPLASSLAQTAATPAPQRPPPALTNFSCDACMRPITAGFPRVHCLTCPDYDLCANCALGERFGGAHTAAHPTTTYRMSGDVRTMPVMSQLSISYGGVAHTPPAYSASVGGKTTSDPSELTSSFQQFTISGGTTAGGISAAPAAPSSSPSSVRQGGTISSFGTTYTYSASAPGDSWSPFFDDEMNPMPIFVGVMGALFAHRDRIGQTGLLTPEAYSRLLDDMGVPFEENPCAYLHPISQSHPVSLS